MTTHHSRNETYLLSGLQAVIVGVVPIHMSGGRVDDGRDDDSECGSGTPLRIVTSEGGPHRGAGDDERDVARLALL